MPVTEFITHSFARQQGGEAKLKLRDSLVPQSEALELFSSELKHAFHRRAGRDYGCFANTGERAVLPQKLTELLDDGINFVTMSVQWMYAMKSLMDELDIPAQGHIVFMREEHLGDEVFYLFVVSYKESLFINNSLEVEQTRYADLGTTLMAARVELSLWQASASRSYLTLAVPRSENAWTETFNTLVGFSNVIDKKSETENFLQSVASFSMEIPDDSVTEFQTRVVGYCLEQDKQGEAVDFLGLSQTVEDIEGVNAKQFSKALNTSQISEEDKVHIDRNSLRRFLRFTGREKDLTLSFSSSQIPERIQYNKNTDILTIKGLPKALREQLLAHYT